MDEIFIINAPPNINNHELIGELVNENRVTKYLAGSLEFIAIAILMKAILIIEYV